MKLLNNLLSVVQNKTNQCKIESANWEFPSCICIQSPAVTLSVCRDLICNEVKGAYLRFGDGDVLLMSGQNDSLQTADRRLAMEMQEAFNLSGPGIMKCLAIHSRRFGLWPGMAPGVHEVDDVQACKLLARCHRYFIGTPIYSPVALAYAVVFDQPLALSFLRFLKDRAPFLFIGNQNVPDEVLSRLFGSSTERISTPSKNSYAEIDRIESDARRALDARKDRFSVIIVAMGCSGRALAKRIYMGGYNAFLFDFGSLLDAFCGWKTRTWIKKAPDDLFLDFLYRI